MKKIAVAAALAASALVATPASAATFIVTLGNAPIDIPDVNNFKGELNDLGMLQESIGALVQVSGFGKIKFEFLGSESFYRDRFNFPGLPGLTEDSLFENNFAAPVQLGTVNVGPGTLQVKFTSNGGSVSRSATPGEAGFAVFLPRGTTGNFEATELYFGYDDRAQFDDNHDDFIVRATISAIPEPATWAMMIGGFGLVGATMRRGRGMKAVTA